MLSRHCHIEDIDPIQWKRLSNLSIAQEASRRLIVTHHGGKLDRCFDTVSGECAPPFAEISDAQGQAEALLAGRAADGVKSVWIVDLEAYHGELSAVQAGLDPLAPSTKQLAREWEKRWVEGVCAVAPRSEFLHHGLPWVSLERFVAKMAPEACVFVLGVFDGGTLWASLFVRIRNAELVGVSTSVALTKDDLRDVSGIESHPFLLSAVAQRYQHPAFGWFCGREDFEAWMLASGSEEKARLFQESLVAGRSVFDFAALLAPAAGPTEVSPGA
jgi:hypothetical protein